MSVTSSGMAAEYSRRDPPAARAARAVSCYPVPMSDAKPSSASAVETTHLVMPSDANGYGTAFGGMVMQWIDVAAGMAAMRHARLPVVTASVDQLNFLAPIRVGDMAILVARVNADFGELAGGRGGRRLRGAADRRPGSGAATPS